MRKKSPLLIIFFTVFMDLIGFGLIIPLVAVYGDHFHASPAELGFLGASYSLAQFVFAPLWGRLSDRYGRRPILLMSLAGSTISYIGFGLATSLWFLIATRLFAGTFAANVSTAQAAIADVTTPEKRAHGMGMLGAAFGLGFLLGPALAAFTLATFKSLGAPGFVAAAFTGVNFLLALKLLPETYPAEARAKAAPRPRVRNPLKAVVKALGHPRLWPLFLMLFLFTFAMANLEQTFSVFFKVHFGLSTRQAGKVTGEVLVWAGFLGIIVQGWLIRKLAPKFGEFRLVAVGGLILAPGAVLLAYGHSVAWYFLFIVPMSLGSGLLSPSLSALVSRGASSDEQGGVLGLSQSLNSLARAVGPFIGLTAFAYYPFLPFYVASTAVLAMLLVALLQRRRIGGILAKPAA